MNNQIKLFCAALALGVTAQASADTTWVLGSTPPTGITVTGYANTGLGSSVDTRALELQPVSSNMIWYSGGWGINNLDGCTSGSTCDVGDVASTAPEHAVDNNQRYEMQLLNFAGLAQPVALSSVTTGWAQTDADLTVLAYTGSGAPTLSGGTWGTLGSGWSLIGHYGVSISGAAQQLRTTAINTGATPTYSSYWLIGAYNPLVGSSAGFSLGNDYFKPYSVAGITRVPPSQVPEPGSLALAGLALVGMTTALRRRRQA